MKLHTMQSNLKALDPAMTFTAAQILRTLDYAVEEVDVALGGAKRRAPTPPKAKRNGNRTALHLEQTALYLMDRGDSQALVALKLGISRSAVCKISERGWQG